MPTVYKFEVYDITTDESRPSRRMATLDAIARARGTPVEGTGREVETSDLDPAEDGMTPRDFHLRSRRTGFQTVVDR
jgi:hypothetical protein